jgi:hypothetical protein
MTELSFKPAPEGPPPRQEKYQYEPVIAWMEEHPGEWAVIENVPQGVAILLKRRGYEATTKMLKVGPPARFDVYARKVVRVSRKRKVSEVSE